MDYCVGLRLTLKCWHGLAENVNGEAIRGAHMLYVLKYPSPSRTRVGSMDDTKRLAAHYMPVIRESSLGRSRSKQEVAGNQSAPIAAVKDEGEDIA